jgi:hypothetical protein
VISLSVLISAIDSRRDPVRCNSLALFLVDVERASQHLQFFSPPDKLGLEEICELFCPAFRLKAVQIMASLSQLLEGYTLVNRQISGNRCQPFRKRSLKRREYSFGRSLAHYRKQTYDVFAQEWETMAK